MLDDLRGRVACVIDGGECLHGVEVSANAIIHTHKLYILYTRVHINFQILYVMNALFRVVLSRLCWMRLLHRRSYYVRAGERKRERERERETKRETQSYILFILHIFILLKLL